MRMYGQYRKGDFLKLPEESGQYQTNIQMQQSSAYRNTIYPADVDLFSTAFKTKKGLNGNQILNESGKQKTMKRSMSSGDLCLELGCANIPREYTEKTTLHGLRYVGEAELHPLERLFWIVAFILGILGAGYFISSIYHRWTDSPMIVSISSTATRIHSIPFPALTICNMNGPKKSIAEEIMRNTQTDLGSQFQKEMIQDMCGKKMNNTRVSADWSQVQKFIINVSQSCNDMLVTCKWQNKAIPCSDMFNPDLTDEGMCCAFNKVDKKYIYRNPKQTPSFMNYTFPFEGIDWSPEAGYPSGTPNDINPLRTWGAGRSMGLTLLLDVDIKEYYCSSTASIGFKAVLHNPVEVSKISDLGFMLTPGMETRVEVIPKIYTSTDQVFGIPVKQRNCLFTQERELRFYRTYTQRNCLLECNSNFTLANCGCVPFYLPKDVEIRVCGTMDDQCVDKSKDSMEQMQRNASVHNGNSNNDPNPCFCLPSCELLEYNKQMSSSYLGENNMQRASYLTTKGGKNYTKENVALVHFFFIEESFLGVEKGEIFGLTEFISSTGGLLGLFLGFSIMSAAEMFYFLSLRIFCSFWRKRRRATKTAMTRASAF